MCKKTASRQSPQPAQSREQEQVGERCQFAIQRPRTWMDIGDDERRDETRQDENRRGAASGIAVLGGIACQIAGG